MWQFWKSKTFWTAVVALIGGMVSYAFQEINLMELGSLFIGVLTIIFMRNGIAKSTGK